MAEKFGGVDAAAIQLGKALNDPIAGVAALRRVGVQLSDAQEQQVKSFMEVGDIASAQAVILGELETQFGGLAVAAGATTEGAMIRLGNAFDNVKETVGSALLPILNSLITNVLMPMLPTAQKLAEVFADLVEGLVAGEDPVGNFANAVWELAKIFGMSEGDAKKLFEQVMGLRDEFDFLVNALKVGDFEAILTRIFGTETTAQIMNVFDAFKQLAESFMKSWPEIKKAGQEFLTWLQLNLGITGPKVLKDIADTIRMLAEFWDKHGSSIIAVIKLVAMVLTGTLTTSMNLATGIVKTGLQMISGAFDMWSAIFRGDWDAAWDARTRTLKAATDTMKFTFESAMNGILSIAGTDLRRFNQQWSDNFSMLGVIITQGSWKIVESIGRLINDSVRAVGDSVGRFVTAGQNLVGGIARGIADSAWRVLQAVANLAGDILRTFTSMLGIRSPSTVFAAYGENILMGLSEGLTNSQPVAINAVASLGSNLIPAGFGGSSVSNVTNNNGDKTLNLNGMSMDRNEVRAIVQDVLRGK
jgi:hypothetical protein